MAQDHPPPDDSTTTSPASDIKAQLDIEKLKLEISELRHWYKRPAFIQSVLAFLITAIVALTGWVNGWFDVQRARLEVQRSEIRIDIEKLQAGKTDLNGQIVALTAERNGLSTRVQTLSKDLDALALKLGHFRNVLQNQNLPARAAWARFSDGQGNIVASLQRHPP